MIKTTIAALGSFGLQKQTLYKYNEVSFKTKPVIHARVWNRYVSEHKDTFEEISFQITL